MRPSATPPPPPMSQPSEIMLGPGVQLLHNYELMRPCGFGGTASVWLAKVIGPPHAIDPAHGASAQQRVAIKIQNHGPRIGAYRSERLEREFHLLEILESPHIVRALDFGYIPDGRAALVFEYLPGRTLREALEEYGVVALKDALSITQQLLLALRTAHTLGIVHRDIKPDNIMLVDTEETQNLHVKLFDFGISKVLGDKLQISCTEDPELAGLLTPLTAAEMTVGTPEYMAPEQISATNLGGFTDVYAVGIALHEMLFGEVPYTGDTFFEIAHRHLAGILPPLPADLPPLVHHIVWKSLACNLQDRYAHAEEMLVDIQRALHHPDVVQYTPVTVDEDMIFGAEASDPLDAPPWNTQETTPEETLWGQTSTDLPPWDPTRVEEAEILSPQEWMSEVSEHSPLSALGALNEPPSELRKLLVEAAQTPETPWEKEPTFWREDRAPSPSPGQPPRALAPPAPDSPLWKTSHVQCRPTQELSVTEWRDVLSDRISAARSSVVESEVESKEPTSSLEVALQPMSQEELIDKWARHPTTVWRPPQP